MTRRLIHWTFGASVGLAVTAAACSSPAAPTPPPLPPMPSVTCPADITAVSNDASALLMTYTVPTATDGSAPVTVSCSPAPGTSFAPGSTTVTCTATDSLNRQATCTFAIKVTVPPRLVRTRFVAFGDSLTAGKSTVSASEVSKLEDWPNSYPSQLAKLLKERYTPQAQAIVMYPEGYSGEATSVGVSRLRKVLTVDRPEVLLLMEGANDIYGGNPLSIPDAVYNLRKMVREAQGTGAQVFLANLPPQRQGGKGSGFALVPSFNAALAPVATETGATLVDVYLALSTDLNAFIGSDGLHPTAAGYLKIAETFLAAIRSSTLEIPGVPTTTAAMSDPFSGRLFVEPAVGSKPARTAVTPGARRQR